ncbi:hypothetical protein WAK64_11145 [Bacillus spongiae]|uniref:DUF8042 domain-containing protein n=1 Tax=Bacillus spongiae TaxID=2683610 RepID=A0ABU8HE20_9BACI
MTKRNRGHGDDMEMIKPIQLTEEQFTICRHYIELLVSVEEACQYVISAFRSQKDANAHVVLLDILSALAQLQKAHPLLLDYFSDDQGVLKSIEDFSVIEEYAMDMVASLEKSELLEMKLFPAFITWKQAADYNVSRYVRQ